MENRYTMLNDGVDYRIGVYGSSEGGEVHQVLGWSLLCGMINKIG